MIKRNDHLKSALQGQVEVNKPSESQYHLLYDHLPILVALEYENYDAVKMLLEHGASVTASRNMYHCEGAWGESALSYVSQRGMKDLLELFLKQNINVNAKASILPALHCAATPEIAQILLDHGANPYLRSNEHKTALECQAKNKDVADLLRAVMSRETEN